MGASAQFESRKHMTENICENVSFSFCLVPNSA